MAASAEHAGKTIVVVGSVNCDLVVRTARAPGPGETVTGQSFARYAGGKGANQATAAARLVQSGRVALIARVGDDREGAWVTAELGAAGVDLAGLGRATEGSTGVALITVSADGENRIVLVAGANHSFTPAVLGQHHDVLTSADVVVLQLEIPLPTVQTAARMGREKRALVILDPAPARPLPTALLRLCDYVTPNLGELAVLLGKRPPAEGAPEPDLATIAADARAVLAQGARNVVVKLGPRGVLIVTPQAAHHVPAPPVTAVDTTAAGDAWNGAFAVALSEGAELLTAAQFANTAAALSVTHPGATPSLPTRPQLDSHPLPTPLPPTQIP